MKFTQTVLLQNFRDEVDLSNIEFDIPVLDGQVLSKYLQIENAGNASEQKVFRSGSQKLWHIVI